MPMPLTKRPCSVLIIGSLFIAAGVAGIIYHAPEFDLKSPLQYDFLLKCFLRLLAVIFGIFLLRGHNWARWALLGWIAGHVVLSAFHSVGELLTHLLLLVFIAYFLLRPKVSAYFRGGS